MNKFKVSILVIVAFSIQNAFGQKNVMQVGFGIAGSDGVDVSFSYDFGYKRKVHKIISMTAQYSKFTSQGYSKSIDIEAYRMAGIIGPKNQSETPINSRSILSSYSLGLELSIVSTFRSKLFLIGAGRYQIWNESLIRSSGSEPDDLLILFDKKKDFGLEYGIGYDRIISRNYYLGGKLIFAPTSFYMGATLTSGVYF